ncbi:MAG: hypothetical protein LBT20_02370 [Clostridiales bacterium]|jgi:hypothetical protein|nr:hypothetical protein [Clostridiales bacterium]
MRKLKKIIVPKDGFRTKKIQNYQWTENGYAPSVSVFLARGRDRLWVKFVIGEAYTLPKYLLDGEPVYKDSAVECFLKPFNDDPRYLNFEFNAAGAGILGFGMGKDEREELIARYAQHLNVTADGDEKKWSLSFEIPFFLIEEIYGRGFAPEREKVHVNFFKCGDETEFPHYGTLFEIDYPYPEFHLPEFFGEAVF